MKSIQNFAAVDKKTNERDYRWYPRMLYLYGKRSICEEAYDRGRQQFHGGRQRISSLL